MLQKVMLCLTGIRIFSTAGTSLLIHLPQLRATFLAVIYLTPSFVFIFNVTSFELLTIDKTSVFSKRSILLTIFKLWIRVLIYLSAIIIPAFVSTNTFLVQAILGAEGNYCLTWSIVTYLMFLEELATFWYSSNYLSSSIKAKKGFDTMKVLLNFFSSSAQFLSIASRVRSR